MLPHKTIMHLLLFKRYGETRCLLFRGERLLVFEKKVIGRILGLQSENVIVLINLHIYWRTSYLVLLARNYLGDLTEKCVMKGKLV